MAEDGFRRRSDTRSEVMSRASRAKSEEEVGADAEEEDDVERGSTVSEDAGR